MSTRVDISGNANTTLTSDSVSGNQFTAALESIEFYDGNGDNFEPTQGQVLYEYQTGLEDEWRPFDAGAVRDYALTESTPAVVTGKVIRRVRATFSGFPANTTVQAVFLASIVPADLISTLMSSREYPIARLQVDSANTGFFAGREFRYFRELNIPEGESVWTRVTVVDDGLILRLQSLTCDDGAIRFRAWRDATPNGVTFGEPTSPTSGLFSNNGLPSAPDYTPVTTIENGGTQTGITGGTVAEVKRLRSGGVFVAQASIGQQFQGERGIAPAVYHLQFENIATGAALGVYDLIYEERVGQG